jgi:3-oxoacyl-[acyl-carrier protein] reductase
LGQPDELANLVVFLASERASYITGVSIAVDGGIVKGLY